MDYLTYNISKTIESLLFRLANEARLFAEWLEIESEKFHRE